MNAMQEKLFLELRHTQAEIENSLKKEQNPDWFIRILEDELTDIKIAIKKMSDGSFGKCEISGEIMPIDLIKNIPTLKSINDSKKLNSFYRKAINPFIVHLTLSFLSIIC
ncbi:hypothetical protein [Neobacillus massiliamazoniensis]|uniref:DksA C4-type domain-containing protein n=1 Tax=Neobacillus massiliamazoniensis TaxID=1499688 RepID=A0A0U1NR87_9BACI|nr:hypothetical protein [Neobacillus massiliamazoniensis]CRK80559.1 hypothetical protein BN000_00445 [Neobacillus massiliamazoniensis]